MSEQINIDELERLARAVEGWKLDCSWTDTSEDTPASVVGCIDEDGRKYPVATIDCDQYFSNDSGRVAEFYAAANPTTVLALINQLRALGDRAMHLERRLSEANGEVLRLQCAQKHALELQAGHDEAVMRAQALEQERAALAAKLKDLEGQQPVGEVTHVDVLPGLLRGNDEGLYRHEFLCSFRLGVQTELFARPVPVEQGHVTVTTDDTGRCILVSRQDDDHRILSVIWEAPEKAAEPVNARLVERISDAIQAYERYGAACVFEGEPMIYASTLTEIAEIAAEAQKAEPVRLTDAELISAGREGGKTGWMTLFRRVEAAVLRKQGYKVEG